MRIEEWLTDLAKNNYVDWIHGEIAILPIRDDGKDDDNS